MPEATPGQAAYEAYVTAVGLPFSAWPWEDDDANQAVWDAVASAVAAPLNAELARLREEAASLRGQLRGEDGDFDARLAVVDGLIAERDAARHRLAQVAAIAAQGGQDDKSVRRQLLRKLLEWGVSPVAGGPLEGGAPPAVTPLDTALEHVREARQFLGERNRYRAALEEIRARGRDGYVTAHVLWSIAVSVLGDGPDSPHIPDDGEVPDPEDAASLDDLEPLEGGNG